MEMNWYVGGYIFMALATAFSLMDDYTWPEFIGSLVCGIWWPMIIAIRLLRKLIN